MPPSSLPKTIEVVLKKSKFDSVKSVGFFILFAIIIIFSFVGQPTGQFIEQYFDSRLKSVDLSEVPEGAAQVGMVRLIGEIMPDGSEVAAFPGLPLITPGMVRAAFQDFDDYKNLKAFLVDLSSPGGTVGASDEIAYIIREKNKEIPIFFYTSDIMASGGYYIATGARKIYTHKQAEVGSIGVIAQVPNVSQLIEKIGFSMETYSSGRLKDLGSPFRPRTLEEKTVIESLLREAFEDFQQVVKEGRKLNQQQVNALSTGEVWLGETAVAKGLIDSTLYFEELGDAIAQELGVPSIYYLQFVQPPSLLDEIFQSTGVKADPLSTALSRFVYQRPRGLYYLRE